MEPEINYKNNMISVIIPVYKVEAYLKKCVESVLYQSYLNLEIILVDDGSPDRCPEICDEIALNNKNVKVIHKDNGGLSDARNAGLRIASGEYILFLDSDDILVEDSIRSLVNRAVETNADMVIPDRYFQVNEDSNKTKKVYHFSKEDFYPEPLEFAVNVMIKKGRAWRAHSLLYKAKIIREHDIKFPVGYIAEDIVFNLSVLTHAKKIDFYEGETVLYLKRAGSITTSFQKNYDEVYLFIDETIENFLLENNILNNETNIYRKQLLSRNIINYTLDLFSKKCEWKINNRLEKLRLIIANERIEEAFKADKVEYFYIKILSKDYFKNILYSILFRLIRNKKANSIYITSKLANKFR